MARVRRPVEPDYVAIAADADRLAPLPRHTLLRVLHLIAQLPALRSGVLHDLVYTRMREDEPDLIGMLEQRGLVRPYFERKHIKDANYAVLTKAGIRVLASGLTVTPEALVARYGLDDTSVADRIGSRYETVWRYRMLATLAREYREAPPGSHSYETVLPQLITWRRHWPPDQPGAPASEPIRSALPALVTLRWGSRVLSYLLLFDPTDEGEPLAHNIRPVEFYGPIIDHLLDGYRHRGGPMPRLFVQIEKQTRHASTNRHGRWLALLQDARRRFPSVQFRFEVVDGSIWFGSRSVSRDVRGESDPEEDE